MGPWRHSGVNYDGTTLGPLNFDGDTALQFRRDVLKPFFDQYLKDGAPKADTPPVFIYNTGENHWDRLTSWPLSCENAAPSNRSRSISLRAPDCRSRHPQRRRASRRMTSTCPIRRSRCRTCRGRSASSDGTDWQRWLLVDQRFVSDRPDVLSYSTPVLDRAGAHQRSTASCTSSRRPAARDADWVVKLIDVYPDAVPERTRDGRLRARNRHGHLPGPLSRELRMRPKPIAPNMPLTYSFVLPTANHVFLPGHRIMVQVQSTLVPALRPQPADLRVEHLLRKARRLREGDQPHLSHGLGGQLPVAAGGADSIAEYVRSTRPVEQQLLNRSPDVALTNRSSKPSSRS